MMKVAPRGKRVPKDGNINTATWLTEMWPFSYGRFLHSLILRSVEMTETKSATLRGNESRAVEVPFITLFELERSRAKDPRAINVMGGTSREASAERRVHSNAQERRDVRAHRTCRL